MKVFVYGTLKTGYGNNRLLQGQTFYGPAVTVDTFDMINAGFPVIVPNEHGHQVMGELFEVDTNIEETLDRLDQLEGEGVMYDRKEIKVGMPNGEKVTTWVYVGNPKYWGRRAVEIKDSKGQLTDRKYIKENSDLGCYLEWGR